ncbi:hypothetical protein M422DRAFT_272267 [Sphaerobolus stellatus SS14]|uniref:F-box domain-containing protein n=1 Tax=Sphaerobolus stellatus (strain SS14) TaxID=990650 RepID=A0A0C9UBY9_SPHS4|nr:hypothetical protein M422DRAFT_272267 [Sphaerobolus stellatus SS14]
MLANAVNILANEGVILLSLESVVLDISVTSYDALEQFLDNCSMLKQLRITVAPVAAFQGDTSIKETSLHLLERLELKLPSKFNPYQLFTSFNAQRLSHFRLTLTKDEGWNQELWVGLIHFFEASSGLEIVVCQNVIFPSERVASLLITALECLTHLNALFIMDGFIGHLLDVLSETHFSEWLCPELSYLNLSIVSIVKDELFRFLNARRGRAEVTGITNLLLRGCRGITAAELLGNVDTATIQQVDIREAIPEIDSSWIEDVADLERNEGNVEAQ